MAGFSFIRAAPMHLGLPSTPPTHTQHLVLEDTPSPWLTGLPHSTAVSGWLNLLPGWLLPSNHSKKGEVETASLLRPGLRS